jgi:uncharacterized protein (TIGR02266 family)
MSRNYVRASERTTLEVPVDFDLRDMTYRGVTRNISAGGVFVVTRDLPKVGETVNLRFHLPGNNRRLSVQTEVRWLREPTPWLDDKVPPGMGLRFINPSAGDVAALEEFLARRDALMGKD